MLHNNDINDLVKLKFVDNFYQNCTSDIDRTTRGEI